MEIIKKFSMLVMMFAISLALLNCTKEGPAGPAGKDGAHGADGKDGNATCGTCHSDKADAVNLIFAQYDLSLHNKGVVYSSVAGRANCSSCHTADGFMQAVKTGTPATANGSAKINCKACHPIHDKYTMEDFAIRVTAQQKVKLLISGETVDFKTGNLCATCHQGRSFNNLVGADTTFKTTGTSTYSRYGPHYGTPANIVAMKGLYPIEGSVNIPSSNPHGNLEQGCVTCHMGKLSTNPATGGHKFQMTAAQMVEIPTCATQCHDATTLTGTPKGKEIASMLKETRQILLDKKFIDISQTTGHDGNYQVLGEYFAQSKDGNYMTKEEVQITLNYLFIAKDRSMGAHNPGYVYALVKNGLDKLKQ
jgi:Zn-finger protein